MQKNELSRKDFKAKPFWEALRKNDIKIEQERDQSINKQMIPKKPEASGTHQYMSKKKQKKNNIHRTSTTLCKPNLFESCMIGSKALSD